jgi:TRAP-type C4-dicarboxylate transport system permease small subunit
MKTVLAMISAVERWLCMLGFAVMAIALVSDVGARLFLGHGIVGAPQFGLVGMLVTALFGVGMAADTGEHFRPQVLDRFVPQRLEGTLVTVGHLVTALFFSLLVGLSVWVAAESARLEDLTALLRWPVWMLQLVFVFAFGFNAIRYFAFAVIPALRPAPPISATETPVAGTAVAGEPR